MNTKLIEIRDHGTCFVALCTKLWPGATVFDYHSLEPSERKLRMLWRYGYKESRAVIFTHIGEPSRTQVDPYAWKDRTLHVAHNHIEEHWDEIPDGGLVDVRVVLGEATEPAESEFQA